jgi:hypothetical protein
MIDKKDVTPEEAVDIFLRIFINHSLDGTINSIKKLLEYGPAGRQKEHDEVALKECYTYFLRERSKPKKE